jgi:hypothetical protein
MNNLPATTRTFHYGELEFSEAIMIGGVPHLTRLAIGEWLEYADPQKAVDNIVDRNPHILEFQLPSVVRAVDGKNREVFVYNPTGFLLIAMESAQPKAIELKIAVAKFVAHFTQVPKIKMNDYRSIRNRITALVKAIVKETDPVSVLEHWEEIVYLCDLIGKPYPNIKLMRQVVEQLTLMGGIDILLPNGKKAKGGDE